jgi:hypothetical protein
METCGFCSSTLKSSYYLIGPVRLCTDCHPKIEERNLAFQRESAGRGIRFASFAALVACVLQWCLSDLSQMGDWKFIAIWLRWGGIAISATLITKAAMTGANGNGSRKLQISSFILTYLAFSLSVVPWLLTNPETHEIDAVFIGSALFLGLVSPIFAVLYASGYAIGYPIITLVFLLGSMTKAWDSTGCKLTISGPHFVAEPAD